jgi:hypothetical protein
MLEAEQCVAEIQALFRFLGDWHDTLNRYRVELPTPDMMLRVA